MAIATAAGFAFMVGYYGLPFVISLFLQQQRGLSPLASGTVFLPMMIIGAVLTPFSARISERVGRKAMVMTGLLIMTAGLALIGLFGSSAPIWVLSLLMMLVGLGGPTISPPATALLLDAVSDDQTGVAAGVFNTARQVGGALAIAVFGGLLTAPNSFTTGMRASLLIAAVVTAVVAAASSRLPARRVGP